MRAESVWPPLEFRFTEPEDVEKYGDRWYKYSERDLIRMPGRDLIALESDLGMSVVDVMNGVRTSAVVGDLAAAWISIRNTDPALAGEFDDFNPMALTIEWRSWTGQGKEQGTTETGTPEQPASGSHPGDELTMETSVPTDIVTLQTLPTSE